MGKEASGKGAIGNSIVGEPVFSSTSSAEQPEADDNIHVTERLGRTVSVAEGPDIGNTHQRAINGKRFVRSFENFIASMIRLERFFVFILVLRFGDTVTAHDMCMFRFMKAVLGEGLLRNHTFIVMTGGDIFQRRHGNGQRFIQWCRNQSGGFLREVMSECQWRLQLFGDTCRTENGILDQIHQLIHSIDNRRRELGYKPYSQGDYDGVAEDRKKAMIISRRYLIEMETDEIRGQILERLARIRMGQTALQQLPQLRELEIESKQLVAKVQVEDRNTDILRVALLQAEFADRSVRDAIILCENLTAGVDA